MIEVYFTDGSIELFNNIIDVNPHKEDNPKLMLLKRKNTEVLLNLDHVKYIITKTE